jgi:acetyl-CoA C-acetyltransferase
MSRHTSQGEEESTMREAAIASAVRLPTGRFLGALKAFSAPALGALVIREAVSRAALDPSSVDECIMGNVVSAGLGQNPARQAALTGGLTDHVAALTVNKVCGSGLKAVMLAAQGISTGDVDVVVAGGMESMSNCPYLLPRVREGLRLGNARIVDAVVHDGLWCAFDHSHMGMTGEVIAEQLRHRARTTGPLRRHESPQGGRRHPRRLVPRRDPARQRSTEERAALVVDRDEPVREDASLETLARLEPAFKEDGTVTAGTHPGWATARRPWS